MASDPQDYVPSGFSQTKKPHSCVLVIFGASGDLTEEAADTCLVQSRVGKALAGTLLGGRFARSDMSDGDFRNKMREAVSEFSRTGLKDEQVWQQFASTLYYVRGDYNRPAHTSVSRA